MLLGVDWLIALGGGIVGALISPWAQGAAARATERARSREQHRRDMLSNGRAMISEARTMDPAKQITNDWRYYHLRQHLADADVLVDPDSGYAEVLDFLDKRETEWGLT